MNVRGIRFNEKIIGLLSVVLFFSVWQFLTQQKILDPIFFGMPTRILEEFIDLFRSGEIIPNIIYSSKIFFGGFILAIAVGTFAGLLISINKKIYFSLKPYIFALNSIPPLILLPLIVIWFGIGEGAKVMIVFIMAFIPVLIATIDAARTVDSTLIAMAKSFGANSTFVLRNITFHHSLPYVFSAIRVAIGRSLVAVVVAEFFGFGEGVGYLISYYSSNFRVDRTFALIVLVVLFSLGLTNFINYIEKRIVTWAKPC